MAKKKRSQLEKFSIEATRWIGTTECLVVHTALFFVAFALVPVIGFDRILNIVTNVVSLEAIYMAIFIQMTVNRHSKHIKNISEDVDDILEDTESLTDNEAS
jgi:low affinity Fe/Cu permease